MLYNMPSMTKVWFEVDTLSKLTSASKIVGIKDSSGDLDYFQQVLKLKEDRPDWSMFIGPEHLTSQAVAFGGDGGVNGGANVFSRIVRCDVRSLCDRRSREVVSTQPTN